MGVGIGILPMLMPHVSIDLKLLVVPRVECGIPQNTYKGISWHNTRMYIECIMSWVSVLYHLQVRPVTKQVPLYIVTLVNKWDNMMCYTTCNLLCHGTVP